MVEQHRWRGPTARGIVLAALVVASAGCVDASRVFGGMWESEAALDGWLTGRPELAIGHFGSELTGVVRFLDDDGIEVGDCLCAFLDQQDIDLDRRTFIVTSSLCDDPPTRLIWELRYDDAGADPRLVGEVRRADDDSTAPLPVSFVLDDTFVLDDRRECDP